MGAAMMIKESPGDGVVRHVEYKLYCLDAAGRILHRHDYLAEGDRDALRIARTREHPEFGCEIWASTRLLGRLPPAR